MNPLGWLWLQVAAPSAMGAPPCVFGPPAHPRVVPVAPARVMLEMRVPVGAPTASIDAAVAPLQEAGLPVVILFPAAWRSDEDGWRPTGAAVDVGLWTDPASLLGSPVADLNAVADGDWRAAFKQARQQVTRATGVRPVAVATPPLPPSGEVALDENRFSTLLTTDPEETALPRRARASGGRMGRTRVISEGIRTDSCGARLGSPAPSALDRVTRTAPSQVVSRVALGPSEDEARAVVLWWETVAAPADWKAWSIRTAFLRLGTAQLVPKASASAPLAQVVIGSEALQAAAQSIVEHRRLPRLLPGSLTPTEALVGLTAMAASPGHARYTVPVISAPIDPSQSMLEAPLPLDEAALRVAATDLLARMDRQAPGLVRVGAHTISTGEYLVALAHLALSRPVVARPISSPDPYAPGGGWGAVRSQ